MKTTISAEGGKIQKYRKSVEDSGLKKNRRPVIIKDRPYTLPRVHYRIRDRNNM